MTAATYDEALRRVLVHEGGYSNHPSDPGGPTNFGITLADYRKYVKPDARAADVRAMKISDAKAIYHAKYWDALRCDNLPAGLDYAVFDYGINSGIARAAKVLHRILGLPDDVRMSDGVIAAVRSHAARDLIARLCEERLIFLRSLRTWPVFGAGWSRRVREVKVAALVMASHAPIRDALVIPPPPDIPAPDISTPRDVAPTTPKTGASIIAAIISILAIFRKRK